MADHEPDDEMVQAAFLCRQHGHMRAAAILCKEGRREMLEAARPRKRMVEVRLAHGGKAWIEKAKLREAKECCN